MCKLLNLQVIEGSGQYAYAQYAEDFNKYLNAVARLIDEGHIFKPGSEETVQAAVASFDEDTINENEGESSANLPHILTDHFT